MDKKQQIDKFREAARQLETDDDEKRFDERLGKIAKATKAGSVPTALEEIMDQNSRSLNGATKSGGD